MALVILLGTALFLHLVPSRRLPEHSLTVWNAASSERTLGIMAVIAALGMPAVLAYTTLIYRTFWGEVRLEEGGY